MRTGYVVLVLLAVMCVDGHGTAEDPEDSTSSVHMMDVLNGFSPFPSFASVAASRTGEAKFVPGRACTRSDARYLCGAKYACVNNKCQHCHTTSDCASPELRCVSSPDGVKYCEHKPLFPNFDINDIYTTILIFIGVNLSALSPHNDAASRDYDVFVSFCCRILFVFVRFVVCRILFVLLLPPTI